MDVVSSDVIHVYPDPSKNGLALNMEMMGLQGKLRQVVVAGLPDISRAVITMDDSKSPPTYKLCIEGTGLLNVMATPGVVGKKTYSNNVCEVFQTLGVEAARTTIMREITQVMEGHGISVDFRHIMLLASQMTARGNVLGITRYGLSKMRESVFNLASVSDFFFIVIVIFICMNALLMDYVSIVFYSLRRRPIICSMQHILVRWITSRASPNVLSSVNRPRLERVCSNCCRKRNASGIRRSRQRFLRNSLAISRRMRRKRRKTKMLLSMGKRRRRRRKRFPLLEKEKENKNKNKENILWNVFFFLRSLEV